MRKYFALFVLASVTITCNGHLPIIGGIIGTAHKHVQSTVQGLASTVQGGFNINFGVSGQAGHKPGSPPHPNHEGPTETVVVVQNNDEHEPHGNMPHPPGYGHHHSHHNHPHPPPPPPPHRPGHNEHGQGSHNHGNYNNHHSSEEDGDCNSSEENENNYGHPSQNHHGKPGYPNQNNYGRPPPNQYGNPGQNQYGYPNGNNHGRPGQNQYGYPNQNNYGRPPQNPYGRPGQNQYGYPNENYHGRPGQNQYGYPNQNYGHGHNTNPGYNQNNNGYNPNNNDVSPDPTSFPNQVRPDQNDGPQNIPTPKPASSTQKPASSTQKPVQKPTVSETTKNPSDEPLFVPLNPNEYVYGGDKINVTAPKRETEGETKPSADSDDDDFPIDVRFQDQ